MSRNNNRRERKYKTRALPRFFIISAEGAKTEKAYFKYIKDNVANGVAINVITDKTESSPKYVLSRIKKQLKKQKEKGKLLMKGDEVWIVIDRDTWEEKEIENCYNWSRENTQYNLALSNPCFEYWLLLHFDKPKSITAKNIIDKLKKHITNYDKLSNTNNCKHFTEDSINKAIVNAKKDRDIMKCKWPQSTGTTVYRLVESIFDK